ncbi:DUF7620 family protein [Mycobacteroides abscessus]|uniref:DUF7620 family protein n=1 Tax=Mycobacteroides abscessus TaxID=36809 RepID=UPI0009291AA1|nr:hypothetical protein [Mycobacteroides abscessus]SIL55812.1 Uncharacterised protein [Mycobacteroides abscessus subsp. abscessus]
MWPWKRRDSADADDRTLAINDADRKLAESQARSQAATEAIERARRAQLVLRNEVTKNGWTELFLASMQRGS